ncbi:hypothetical protein O9929_15980 [Vibrio lentus]|nr:hypothetical protein [Vibrio lentus]
MEATWREGRARRTWSGKRMSPAAKGAGDYQLARSWAFGDYPEPSALLEAFTCGHTANESGYCNSDYDEPCSKRAKRKISLNVFASISAC